MTGSTEWSRWYAADQTAKQGDLKGLQAQADNGDDQAAQLLAERLYERSDAEGLARRHDDWAARLLEKLLDEQAEAEKQLDEENDVAELLAEGGDVEQLRVMVDADHDRKVILDGSTEVHISPWGAQEQVNPTPSDKSGVFVVHGRDSGTKETVARVLRQLTGEEPVILHEQPDGGATVIEKFERHARAAAAAVVILTPDDIGGIATAGLQLQPRARQNVVYELGWFHGSLGRGRVVALLVGDVEQPSDFGGVLYIHVDEAGAWRYRLGRELKHAGIEVDLNNLR